MIHYLLFNHAIYVHFSVKLVPKSEKKYLIFNYY